MTVLAVVVAAGGFKRLGPASVTSVPPPESLRLLSMACLVDLVRALPATGSELFAGVANDTVWKPLTHAVFGLLETAENNMFVLDVRQAALRTLCDLLTRIGISRNDMMRILPGVVSTGSKLCLRDAKESHRIVELAARALGIAVSVALAVDESEGSTTERKAEDLRSWAEQLEQWKGQSSAVAGGTFSLHATQSIPNAVKPNERDSQALDRLQKLVPVLFAQLRNHQHPQVVAASVDFASKVGLAALPRSPQIATDSLETLMMVSESTEHLELRSRAASAVKTCFDALRSPNTAGAGGEVERRLQSRCRELLDQAPDMIRRAVFGKLNLDSFHLLNAFVGFQDLYGGQAIIAGLNHENWLTDIDQELGNLLADGSQKKQPREKSAVAALLGGNAVDVGRRLVREDVAMATRQELQGFLNCMMRLLSLLGTHDNSFGNSVSSRIAEVLLSSELSAGSVFIFEHGGAPFIAKFDRMQLRHILELALRTGGSTASASAWERRVVRPEPSASPSRQPHDTVLRLEISRACVEHLDVPLLEPVLPFLLFACLSNMGIGAVDAERASIATLEVTAKKLAYEHMASLVVDNIDNVIDMFCSRLRRLYLKPEVPRALQSAIVVAGARVVPFIHDTVDEVLDALDVWKRNDEVTITLLGILGDIGAAVAQAASAAKPAAEHASKEVPVPPGLDSTVSKEMRAFWLKWGPIDTKSDDETNDLAKETPRTTEKDPESVEEDSYQGNDEEPSENEKKKDPIATLLITILDKCVNFLSHPSATVRRQLLEVFRRALPGLKEAQRDLLPLIHRIWPTLVFRLGDADRFVALETLLVVSLLAELSKDFLTKRVSDDVIPRLSRVWQAVFKGMEEVVLDRRAAVMSRATFNARLVKEMVSAVTTLLLHVPLRLKELHLIEQDIGPLLDVVATASKDDTAGPIGLLRAVALQDWEGVWLLVQAWLGHEQIPDWYLGAEAARRHSKIPQRLKEDTAKKILEQT